MTQAFFPFSSKTDSGPDKIFCCLQSWEIRAMHAYNFFSLFSSILFSFFSFSFPFFFFFPFPFSLFSPFFFHLPSLPTKGSPCLQSQIAGSRTLSCPPQTPLAGPQTPLAGPHTPLAGPKTPPAGPETPLADPQTPTAVPQTPFAGRDFSPFYRTLRAAALLRSETLQQQRSRARKPLTI